MATSSIHIGNGGDGYFGHNSREQETTNSIFKDEQNYCSCSKNEAFEIYRSELKIRSEKYTNRTGQKLQKNVITHLSAIVNFNKEHTEKDIKKVCDYLEKKYDTKVIQFSMHRDEGHISEDGEKIKNYHAHIEFLGLDSQGKSLKRNFHKKELSELQTEVAKLLNMERGKNFNKEFKEFKNGERANMPTKAKRLDTYDYKAHKQEETKQTLAKQKDLKEIISKLRSDLREKKAVRADYANLEQLNKDFKAQIKAKELTIEELNSKILEYQREQSKERLKSDDIQNKLINARETIEIQKTTIDMLKREKINSTQDLEDLKAYTEQEFNTKFEKTPTITQIFIVFVKKIKELIVKINELTAENRKLQTKNTDLKIKIIELEADIEVSKDVDMSNKEINSEISELNMPERKKPRRNR